MNFKTKVAFTERFLGNHNNHNNSDPFFIVFAAQNVHIPLQVPEKYTSIYQHIENLNRRKYLGLVSMFDETILNITEKLSDLNYLNET
jgi:hypothetical protein